MRSPASARGWSASHTIVGGSFSSCSGESYRRPILRRRLEARVPSERVGRRGRGPPGGCTAGRKCCTGVQRRGPGPRPQRSLSPRVRGRRERHRGLDERRQRRHPADAVLPLRGAARPLGRGVGDIEGHPLAASHTTADFVKATPSGFALPPPPNTTSPTFDATAFHGVQSGTELSYVVSGFNGFVAPTGTAQLFRAAVRALAGGCNLLDSRDLLVLVPRLPVGGQ